MESLVYHHSESANFPVLDDCELFAALISKPIPVSSERGESKFQDICVGDITGGGQRQWSLLSFSFNLNPALRDQLSSEMSLLYADTSDHMTRGDQDAIRTVQKKTLSE